MIAAQTSAGKATAYRQLFEFISVEELRELQSHKNHAVALQAAWEASRKMVKRKPPVPGLADWTYDAKDMDTILAALDKRTGIKTPKWFANALRDSSVFPGEHHAFVTRTTPVPVNTYRVIPRGLNFWGDNRLRVTLSPDLQGLKDVYPIGSTPLHFENGPWSAGFAYELSLVKPTGNGFDRIWRADVWSAGRTLLMGASHHTLAVHVASGKVILYGMESHGAYVEAFNLADGSPVFRFCTCYWFNNSEAWDLAWQPVRGKPVTR